MAHQINLAWGRLFSTHNIVLNTPLSLKKEIEAPVILWPTPLNKEEE
jgi:hypothetical protein